MHKNTILILIILPIFLGNCKLTFKESLNVENVRDPTKNLFSFQFDFEFPIDFNRQDSEVYTFSRSVLENIFINSGTTHTRVEAACGTVNPMFLTEENIEENYFFPSNGMKLFADSNTDYIILIESLGEIFRLTKNNVRKNNHYLVKNDLLNYQQKNNNNENVFQGDYWYAQDPTDFICTNNIEKLKRYFPCGGNKGFISIIDQTLLFKADYISIESNLSYNKHQQQVTISFKINTIINKKDYQSYFVFNNKQSCPISTETNIKIEEKQINNIDNLEKLDITDLLKDITQDKQSRDISLFNHLPAIQSQRYMGDRWFDFDGNLVHEIKNNDKQNSIDIQTTEYLIWQFQPIMHKMKVIRNEKSEEQNNVEYNLEIDEGVSYKISYKINLKPQDTIRIIIPMHKLMKSFENYPHDPQRGHDLISASLIYKINNSNNSNNNNKVNHVKTDSLLVRLPEPDFSMPFNIMTYVCVLLGYVFLTVFLNSSTKPK